MERLNDTSRRVSFQVKPQVQREIARLNLSQNQLARRCRLSSAHMSQMLTGKRYAGPKARRRLMSVLKLPFDELFEEVK